MLDILKNTLKARKELPARAWRMQYLDEFRTSTIYDRLPHDFCDEAQADGRYIPLRDRKPSVRYGLPMVIVNDTTSLLFSEAHFPKVQCTVGRKKERDDGDEAIDDFLGEVIEEAEFRVHMLDGATRGSCGSACFWLKVIQGRLFLEAMTTTYLTPAWRADNPRELATVKELRIVKGSALKEEGYPIKDGDKEREFFYAREWNEKAEVWFVPWPVLKPEGIPKGDYADPYTIDTARTTEHNLGFVPMFWCKNLPGGDKYDGVSTFEAALHNSVEIDYQLSQAGRGLKYSSDPTLVLREAGMNIAEAREPIKRSAGSAIALGPEDDASLLEISGTAVAAVEGYVRHLRELSLELCGGNRASPEKLSGAQSGRAMEMMNQGLIWLADKLRTSYGQGALVALLRMVLRINEKFDLIVKEERYVRGGFGRADKVRIVLKWPRWYAPTASDHANQANAIKVYREAGVLSRPTAINHIAHDFDIEDVAAEEKLLEKETEEKQEAEMALATAAPPKPLKDAA